MHERMSRRATIDEDNDSPDAQRRARYNYSKRMNPGAKELAQQVPQAKIIW